LSSIFPALVFTKSAIWPCAGAQEDRHAQFAAQRILLHTASFTGMVCPMALIAISST
jgi:hypothetical protein